MQRPLAVVIVGGTIRAGALTLVVLRAMYRYCVKIPDRFAARASCRV